MCRHGGREQELNRREIVKLSIVIITVGHTTSPPDHFPDIHNVEPGNQV